MGLAHDGTDGQKEMTAGALMCLADNADNKAAIAKEGGIAPLVALARNGTEKQKERALGATRTKIKSNRRQRAGIM